MDTNKEMQWISKMSFLMNTLMSATIVMGVLIVWLAYSYALKIKHHGHIIADKKESIKIDGKIETNATASIHKSDNPTEEKLNEESPTLSVEPSNDEEIVKFEEQPVNVTYYLVAASLTNKTNSKKIISSLKQKVENPILIEDENQGKSTYRVCVFEASNLEDAKRKREELNTKGIETWVLKK